MTSWLLWTLLASIGAAQPSVRFHHVHYRVGDPSAAMREVAAKLDGPRVMVPGLGVGVKAGAEFLLFDRLDPSDRQAAEQPRVHDAYRAAVAWLSKHGVVAVPGEAALLRVAPALLDERYDHLAFVTTDLPRLKDQLSGSGAATVRRTEDAILYDTGAGVLVELVRETGRPDAFWCPMHPDVRSADGGSCHVCGMELVAIPPPKIGEYNIDVSQLREKGSEGLSGLKLVVHDPETNSRVTKFVNMHEQLLHLFIVGRDLQYFEHVHPEVAPDGSFLLSHAVPPGEYMLIADFLPEGGTTQMVQRALIVGGKVRPAPSVAPSPDVRVTLESENFEAGKHACLTFTVQDARTGEPITDLQPYLGAPAHMLIVRADLGDAIHAHPEEIATGGPTISFHPLVPAAGGYKLWIQIKRGGRVITVPFVLRAER